MVRCDGIVYIDDRSCERNAMSADDSGNPG